MRIRRSNCALCGTKFGSSRNFGRHDRRIHGNGLGCARSFAARLVPARTQRNAVAGSSVFYLDGQTQSAIKSAAKAVEAAVLGKHEDLEMIARGRHGVALRDAYDFSGSIRELVHAIEIARRRGAADREAKLLNSLGNTYNDAGLQYEALEYIQVRMRLSQLIHSAA